MSLHNIIPIKADSKTNSTLTDGYNYYNCLKKFNQESQRNKGNILTLQNNNNNTNTNTNNQSILSESPTNLDLSNHNSNVNANKSDLKSCNDNESGGDTFVHKTRYDRYNIQIKKDKPPLHHISFVDKLSPFPSLATVVDIKSYKESNFYNTFCEGDKAEHNSDNKHKSNHKYKCCIIT